VQGTLRCSRDRFSFQISFQAVQQGDRIRSIAPDPALMNMFDRQGIEIIPALATNPTHEHKVSFFQHSQMLHHRAPVELAELRAEVTRRLRCIFQRIHHASPDRRGQRPENQVSFIIA